MSFARWSIWVSALALCAACASTPESPATQPASPKSAAPASAEPCGQLAHQLCDELGPTSESCRATIGVIALLPKKSCEQALTDFAESRERVAALRGACDELAKAICAELGEESASCGALRADMPDIPPGHCPMLLRDRDQILAALRQRETLDQPLAADRWQALTSGAVASAGAPTAAVTIVEFSDFQCPYCAEAARTLKRIKEQHGDKVRVIFRQYPLPFHDHAQEAAQAALAAHAQGKFWELHDLMFAHQDALDKASLEAYAKQAGLDVKKFGAALDAPETAQAVAADVALGDSVQVRGTPTVFVNGKRLENGVELEAVSAAVDAALQAAAQP